MDMDKYPIGYRTKGTPSLVMTEEGWRADTRPTHHHKNNWDYCRPWIYMITLNCQHHDVMPMPVEGSEARGDCSGACGDCSEARLREINRRLQELYSHKGKPHLFGELVMEEGAAPVLPIEADLREGNPRIRLSRFGQLVEKAIDDLPKGLPVAILDRVVMPNHVHCVIKIQEQLP